MTKTKSKFAVKINTGLHSWGSQFDLEQDMETGECLSPSTASRSSARSGKARSGKKAASSCGAGSTLDQSSFEEDEPPQSLQYEELLEVVTKLKIDFYCFSTFTLIHCHFHHRTFKKKILKKFSSQIKNVSAISEIMLYLI